MAEREDAVLEIKAPVDVKQYGERHFIFTKKIPDNLVCKICNNILFNSHQSAECGHVFCKGCIPEQGRRWPLPFTRRQPCPIQECQRSTTINKDVNTDNQVKALEIKCVHFGDGCEWIGQLDHLDNHRMRDCPEEETSCDRGCDIKAKRKDVQRHLRDECPQREYRCNNCGDEGIYARIKGQHYKDCEGIYIECPNNCGNNEDINAIEGIEAHLEICPLQKKKCRYWVVGCRDLVHSENTEQHEQDRKRDHEDMILRALQNIMISSGQLKEKPWLEEKHKFPTSPWILKLEGYEEKLNQEGPWRSESFFGSPKGYCFILRVYLKGKDGTGRYLTVSPTLRSGPNDEHLKWPFTGYVHIELLSQNNSSTRHKETSYFSVVGGNAGKRPQEGQINEVGCGIPKYIERSRLNGEFLKEDTLYFRIIVDEQFGQQNAN